MTSMALSAEERATRARRSGSTSALVQGVAIATSIVAVPLTVSYLGPERYGIWLTINSVLTWLYLGQMGLGGNALVTRLSRSISENDTHSAGELVSTSFFALVGTALAIGVPLVALSLVTDWRVAFNASARVSASEIGAAVTLSLILFLFLFPSSVIDAVFAAHHEGFIANGWALAANLASFFGLIAAVSWQASLPWLVVAVFGAKVVTGVLAGISLFLRRPNLLPNPRRFSRRCLQSLGGLGVRYLVAQLTSMGMFQSQPFIITQILGPGAVGVFSVTQRLLTIPLTIVQSMSNAHVAAWSQAFVEKQKQWLRHSLQRSTMQACAIGGGLIVAIGLVARSIILVWAGPVLVPPAWLVFWMVLYAVTACLVTPASSLLYATERVGRQALYGILNAALTIVLGIIFTRSWGLTGLGAAMFVALLLVNPIAQWRELRAAGIVGAKEAVR